MKKRLDQLRVKRQGHTVTAVYMSNGIVCPSIAMGKIPQIKRLQHLVIAKWDVQKCRELFKYCHSEEVQNKSDLSGYTAWCTATILYARWFTSVRGKKTFDFTGRFFNRLTKQSKEAHGKLINLRHEFFAHRGDSPYHHAIIGLALNPKNKDPKILNIFYGDFISGMVNKDTLSRFIVLCDEIIMLLNTEVLAAENWLLDALREDYRDDIQALYKIATEPADSTEARLLPIIWEQEYSD